MADNLFKAALTATFQPTRSFLIPGERVVIDFRLVVTLAATVVWYAEFAEDPNAAADEWATEVAEEDAGNGAVLMPKVLRTFAPSGGGALAAATHKLTAQMPRQHKFCRIQIRASAGTVTEARVDAVFSGGSYPVP